MYICLNVSIESETAKYLDQVGVSVEVCESIFSIFQLNNYKFSHISDILYIIVSIFKLTNFTKY